MTKQNRLPKLMNTDLGYNPEGKKAFAKEAKRQLRRLAKELDLPTGSYDLRYNEGGIAVSGEATLHTDNLYVQIEKGFSPGTVMYRACDNRKDFTGKTNHFTDEGVFDEDRIGDFADELRQLADRQAA